MLAGEMNHRVKNILAITSALTTISARSTTAKDEMVKDLRQRIFALSKAHDMVRPDFSQQKKAAELGDLLVTLSCCRFDGRLVKLIPPCARTQQG
jgi:two-component sensor histidine kinase